MALAPNQKEGTPVGFICDWVYVTITNPKANIFTAQMLENTAIPIPINHGEGRFMFSATEPVLSTQVSIQYCDEHGARKTQFPINPNGATQNIAAISNTKGNALAIMPHPERATFMKQIPSWLQNPWSIQKLTKSNHFKQGPWAPLFAGMIHYISENRSKWH